MDKLIRVISEDGGVVCYCIDTTETVRRAEQIHKTSAVVSAALGRLLTAASIMGSMLKSDDCSITLRINGNGPASSVVAVSDARGNTRGYVVNPIVELPLNQYGKLDVAGAVGKEGFLYVIKDLGFGDPYVGQVPIVSGEIAEDITSYFAVSEQIPTVCGLGVLVNPDLSIKSAGGYIIQLLPGASEDTIDRLESNINALDPVSKMISEGMTPQDIAFKALEGFSPQIIDEVPVEYRCNCSKERVERALVSLGREELTSMAEEKDDTEVSCHFCNKSYKFNTKEILSLIK